MNKEFVPYEQALALKELGFEEHCMSSRDMNNGNGLIQLPLKQQAFRFFREKHDLDVISRPHIEKSKKYVCDWCRNVLLNTEYGVEKLDEHLEQWKQFKKK